jgi:hypothetical protein
MGADLGYCLEENSSLLLLNLTRLEMRTPAMSVIIMSGSCYYSVFLMEKVLSYEILLMLLL